MKTCKQGIRDKIEVCHQSIGQVNNWIAIYQTSMSK